MQIGIIGLPQTGKKTLFSLLTGSAVTPERMSKRNAKDPNIGVSYVHDERLSKLSTLYNPKKTIPATITYYLLPDLTKQSEENQEAFRSIATVDALCHVVRAFDDPAIFHISGDVDPARDIEYIEAELVLHDLMFTENRIEKLDKDLRRQRDIRLEKERELMGRIFDELMQSIPLRVIDFNDDEKKILNAYPYLSRKNMFIVLNVNEDDVVSSERSAKLIEKFSSQGFHFVPVSCKIEQELMDIHEREEKQAFLSSMGLDHSALERITQVSYDALGYISFFTVGEDEVRAWSIRKGTNARTASGAIHSDIERGFIRAEHMHHKDLLELGSEEKVKEAGKFSLKGKEYIVQDGDILHFRFNV